MRYIALIVLLAALAACGSTTTTQQAAASMPGITCAGIHGDLATVVKDLKAGELEGQEAWVTDKHTGDLQILINDTSAANSSNAFNNEVQAFHFDASSYLSVNKPALAPGWQFTYTQVTDEINALAADCGLPTVQLTASQLAAQKAAQAKAAKARKAAAARAARIAAARRARAAAARAAQIAAEDTPISADLWADVIRNPDNYTGNIYTITGTVSQYNLDSNSLAEQPGDDAALVAEDYDGNQFVVEGTASVLGSAQPGEHVHRESDRGGRGGGGEHDLRRHQRGARLRRLDLHRHRLIDLTKGSQQTDGALLGAGSCLGVL